MAFHLHRRKLVGRPLIAAGYHKDDAADLAAARTRLTAVRLARLAEALCVEFQDLSRDLSEHEARAWSFYRAAARDPKFVWTAARQAWSNAGLTDKEAAAIIGVKPSTLAHYPARSVALTFNAAQRLTSALNIPRGPEIFLPLQKRDDGGRSR